VLKLDFEKGIKIVLAEVTLKRDMPLMAAYPPNLWTS